jgi:hypothetical protein
VKPVLPINRNRSTHQVKPFCLSSETVLPIKRNRSTYQTVLPIKCNLCRYIKGEDPGDLTVTITTDDANSRFIIQDTAGLCHPTPGGCQIGYMDYNARRQWRLQPHALLTRAAAAPRGVMDHTGCHVQNGVLTAK